MSPIITNKATAIISVYDKTGLLDLAKGLVKQNVRLLASGGTAKMIRESGMPVEYVALPRGCDVNHTDCVLGMFPLLHTLQRCLVVVSRPSTQPSTLAS